MSEKDEGVTRMFIALLDEKIEVNRLQAENAELRAEVARLKELYDITLEQLIQLETQTSRSDRWNG